MLEYVGFSAVQLPLDTLLPLIQTLLPRRVIKDSVFEERIKEAYANRLTGFHSDLCFPAHLTLVICVSPVGIHKTLNLCNWAS